MLSCSQPPLLSEMIRVVYEATQDKAFLEEQYSYLEQEHTYWTKEPRQVSVVKNGIAYKLSRYWSTRRTPRPESYRSVFVSCVCAICSFTEFWLGMRKRDAEALGVVLF